MNNPFVYGEIVPLEAFADRVDRARPPGHRPRRGPEGLPDLAAPLRQVVAGPAGAGAAGAQARSLTLEVTVSSFSSYVAFLEGYARALLALETQGRDGARLAARAVPRLAARGAARGRPGRRRPRGLLPRRPHAARRRRLAEEVFALPGAARRAAAPPDRHRPRRVPGDGRLRRRPGRARAARRRAAAAAGRLRVRRLRAEPDGADGRAEAAVLQGRPGDAAREDPGRRVRGVPRGALRGDRASKPEAGLGDAIVDLAGNLPYDVQRLAHETWDDAADAEAPHASASRICTRRCTGCSASSTCCSRRPGSA